MAFPPVEPARAVLNEVWAYMNSHKHEGNTFGGELTDYSGVECQAACTPLELPPIAECVLSTDAGWTGSEQRSRKAYAIKWQGGTIMHRLSTIHACMPSSFMAEAEALHDGVEAGDYVVDALVEFGHLGSSEVLTLGDNEGLVKTVRLKAKGGSKFHRRKITIICERLERKRYNVRHISTEQMPVDFMTKLIGKKKHRASIKYLYNLGNLVANGVPAPAEPSIVD